MALDEFGIAVARTARRGPVLWTSCCALWLLPELDATAWPSRWSRQHLSEAVFRDRPRQYRPLRMPIHTTRPSRPNLLYPFRHPPSAASPTRRKPPSRVWPRLHSIRASACLNGSALSKKIGRAHV